MPEPNTKNAFNIDSVPDDDHDLEDLRALKKVKAEISKKKRALKDKQFLAEHPDLVSMVSEHRRRKVTRAEEPTEEGKVKLDVKAEKPNVENVKLGASKPQSIDYDRLANMVVAEMNKQKDDLDFLTPTKPKPTKEKQFNETIEKKVKDMPKAEPIKTVVMTNGTFF